MSYETVKDWTTKSGLRAVVLLVNDGSHHCGYVEVPEGHPLHGVDYAQPTRALAGIDEAGMTLGKKSALLILTAGIDAAEGESVRKSPDTVFDVHGGITYAGGGSGYPADGAGWWFGYDCAHSGDQTGNRAFPGDVWRDVDYCVNECESLAEQIVALTGAGGDA